MPASLKEMDLPMRNWHGLLIAAVAFAGTAEIALAQVMMAFPPTATKTSAASRGNFFTAQQTTQPQARNNFYTAQQTQPPSRGNFFLMQQTPQTQQTPGTQQTPQTPQTQPSQTDPNASQSPERRSDDNPASMGRSKRTIGYGGMAASSGLSSAATANGGALAAGAPNN